MPSEFIEHQGQRILLMNFSRIRDPVLLLREIELARGVVASQPRRKELLTVVDLKGLQFNDQILKAFRELDVQDEPYERAAAVCGLSAIGRIAFRAHKLLTGGRMVAFESREAALDWLVQQKL